jgi:hypothetical protein
MTTNRSKLLTALVAAGCAGALAACGSSGKPNTTAHISNQALQFANCMRSHGVPNLFFSIGSGIDPRSTAFKQSAARCGLNLP